MQNVSGLNRHAAQHKVLNDSKNRLVTAYLRLVDLLRPRFLLMEQVGHGYGMHYSCGTCIQPRHV